MTTTKTTIKTAKSALTSAKRDAVSSRFTGTFFTQGACPLEPLFDGFDGAFTAAFRGK